MVDNMKGHETNHKSIPVIHRAMDNVVVVRPSTHIPRIVGGNGEVACDVLKPLGTTLK